MLLFIVFGCSLYYCITNEIVPIPIFFFNISLFNNIEILMNRNELTMILAAVILLRNLLGYLLIFYTLILFNKYETNNIFEGKSPAVNIYLDNY